MLKARSGHIRLKKAKYKDMLDVFPKLYNTFLEVTGQDLEENQEVNNMLLQINLRDLEANNKPEGFNRQRSIRMIFPIAKRPEFYFYSDGRTMEVAKATETASRILEEAGIEHTIAWDEMYSDELKRRKELLRGK